MRAPISYREAVLWIAAIAVSNTVTAHITRTSTLTSTLNQPVATEPVQPTSDIVTNVSMSAPYRDGLFMAKLNQQRGDFSQVPVGRWSTLADRAAFVSGYESGYKITSLSAN